MNRRSPASRRADVIARAHEHRYVIVGAIAFAVALVVAFVVIRPDRVSAIGFDTASTVVYFQRLVAGQRLEVFLGTTPKPLLTLVDGALYGLFHDWRAIGIVAAAMFALGVGLATVLAGRVSGSIVGAVFVASALAGSWLLLQDAAFAYAYSWMLAAVAAAGLAVSGGKPHYAAAGVALLAGTLARPEVLFVTGLGVIAYAAIVIRARVTGRQLRSRWGMTLAIALLAVPIQLWHDFMLSGDPLYTLRVQAIGAAGRIDISDLGGAARLVINHYESWPVLLAIGAAGVVATVRRRQWPATIALLGLGPLAIVSVLAVGWRKLIVLERYLTPVDVAIVFAAGIAVGVAWTWLRGAVERRGLGPAPAVLELASGAALPLAIVAALVLNDRVGPLDGSLRAQLARESRAAFEVAALMPVVAREVDAISGIRELRRIAVQIRTRGSAIWTASRCSCRHVSYRRSSRSWRSQAIAWR